MSKNEKNKGLALGISLTATGVGGFLIPKYLTPYVAENGWRASCFLLFVIVMVAIPLVFFLIKEQAPLETESTEKKY